MTSPRLRDFPPEWRRQHRRENRIERERIAALMKAYWARDSAAVFYNMTCDLFPWSRAFKEFAKLTAVPKKMQRAFQAAWVETKGTSLSASDPALLTTALRAIMPPYTGRRAVRLFRGASWVEHERREYGHSWTASAAAAEDFARDPRQTLPGGSVLLETLVPPSAIISKFKYPKPFTSAEKAAFLSEGPNIKIVEWHEEQEYLVDPRELGEVTVRQRYSELTHDEYLARSG